MTTWLMDMAGTASLCQHSPKINVTQHNSSEYKSRVGFITTPLYYYKSKCCL